MISVVTVTYNRSLQLKRGIETILRQEVLPDELVIVDDGSIDDTAKVADKLIQYALDRGVKSQYIYLDYPQPRISCIPRNVGWKAAGGDIIVFTESECLHVGETIKQITDRLQETEMTPVATQVWTMGQRIYGKLSDDDFRHPGRILSHEYAQLTDNGNMNNINAPDADFAITGSMNCVVGCLFACRKKWLEKVGGFDESFQGHGFDDFDLFNRLAMIGHGIVHCNDIPVIHQWHEKNYSYNIYEAAEHNGKISEDNVKKGIYKVNGSP